MRDTRIHVENGLLFSHQEIADVLTAVTGLSVPPSRYLRTGCKKRREAQFISNDPQKVTCQDCRAYAGDEHGNMADVIASVLINSSSLGFDQWGVCERAMKDHERMADAFRKESGS